MRAVIGARRGIMNMSICETDTPALGVRAELANRSAQTISIRSWSRMAMLHEREKIGTRIVPRHIELPAPEPAEAAGDTGKAGRLRPGRTPE
jgi:hypothetical protein